MNILMPCPFCGSEAVFGQIDDDCDPPHPDQGGHFIQCTNGRCGASTNLRYAAGDDPKPLLAEQWNRRTENIEALQELDRIAAVLGMQDTSDDMADEIERLIYERDKTSTVDDALMSKCHTSGALTQCQHPDCRTWRSKPCGEGCYWEPSAQVAFIKQTYGAIVATIHETDEQVCEVQWHNDGTFGLIVHRRHANSDQWDDLTVYLKPEHFTALGSVPSAVIPTAQKDNRS